MRVDLGDAIVTVLDAGRLWLDGGAMFGVVPKTLWSRERPADDANRIELALNLVLVEEQPGTTLLDTGIGTKSDEKERSIYGIEPRTADDMLRPAGIAAADVDRVVLTHLHFDHAGGNTVRAPDGTLVPAFSRAEYVVQEGEIEIARYDNERIRASFPPDNFEPLLRESGRVRAVRGDVAITPRIAARLAPGHTPHMQVLLVRGGRRTLAFPADLVPTTSHLRYPFVMGFDLEPLATIASKKRFLPEAVRNDWLIVFEHDADTPIASLHEEGGRIVARPFRGE